MITNAHQWRVRTRQTGASLQVVLYKGICRRRTLDLILASFHLEHRSVSGFRGEASLVEALDDELCSSSGLDLLHSISRRSGVVDSTILVLD